MRLNAAYGFAPLGAAAVPALGGMLEDGAAEVRARAVDTLGDVGPPAAGAEAALIAALGDESELVRGHAADALGTVYADAADAAPAAAALAAALEDENEVVRRNAALSLARVGSAAGTGGRPGRHAALAAGPRRHQPLRARLLGARPAPAGNAARSGASCSPTWSRRAGTRPNNRD